MRPLKLLTLALAAMLSTSIAAATAQALEFRILPAKAGFSFKGEGSARLEALSKKAIECEKVQGKGEFSSERLGKLELKFESCKDFFSMSCTGLGDTAGNITISTEFHLRHLLGTAGKPSENASLVVLVGHIHFSCEGIVLYLVLGSVCSDDILFARGGGSAIERLLAKLFVNFLISTTNRGDPIVTAVDTDNSLGMENCELFAKEGSAEYESSALAAEGYMEECKPNACTFLIDLLGQY